LTIEITCRCGAVGVALSGEPRAQFYCHCDDCQIVHGGAYIAVAAYPTPNVAVTRGAPFEWKLKVTPRSTCRECGTRVFARRPDAPICGVNAYLLPPGAFRPAFHIFCAFARLPVKDDLPHFRFAPAAFGGSDERVAW
jgi:hypothetical protein